MGNPQARLTGQKFGLITVVNFYGIINSKAHWKCRCDCGKEIILMSSRIKNKVRSCGCAREATNAKRLTKHGLSRSRVYKIWQGMLQRCHNENDKRYSEWGGRGIKVCDRWHTFENFFEDMGHPTTSRHQIDRRDNNGNYEKSNCRWVTPKIQANNRSNSRKLAYVRVQVA